MESINKAVSSFNRNYLRYGPNTVFIFLFTLIWMYIYKSEYTFDPDIAKLYQAIETKYYWQFIIALFLASIPLSIVLSWPMLIVHIFRTDAEKMKKLATIRANDKKNEESEFTDTIRDCREYGSSLIGIGLSLWQIYIIYSEYFYSKKMAYFSIDVFILGTILIGIGSIVWYRSYCLESKCLDEPLNFLGRSNNEPRRIYIVAGAKLK